MKKMFLSSVMIIVLTTLVIFSSISVIASWFFSGITANRISTGVVKGSLEESVSEKILLYPGIEFEKDIVAENTGNVDILVRVKVEKYWMSKLNNEEYFQDDEFSAENIELVYNDDKWLYDEAEGWLYYKDILKPSQVSETIIDKVLIKSSVSNEFQDKIVGFDASMECIQAAGNGVSFWNRTLDNLGIDYESKKTSVISEVTFNNPEKGFSDNLNDSDLFKSFKTMVPGESRSQQIKLTNLHSEKIDMFLWSEWDSDSNPLVKEIFENYSNITIQIEGGEVIYSGSIKESYLRFPNSSHYLLSTLNPNETRIINVSLSLDENLSSNYQDLIGEIKWGFGAGDVSKVIDPPKTGEILRLVSFSILFVSAILLLILKGIMKRRLVLRSK